MDIVITITVDRESNRAAYIHSALQPGDAAMIVDALRLLEGEAIRLALHDARESGRQPAETGDSATP